MREKQVSSVKMLALCWSSRFPYQPDTRQWCLRRTTIRRERDSSSLSLSIIDCCSEGRAIEEGLESL